MTLSKDIMKIGRRCFYDNSITSVNLEDCTSLFEIGSEAFQMNNLIEVKLPENTLNLATVAKDAFDSNVKIN